MINRIISFVIAITIFSGCDTTVQKGQSNRILPNVTGGAGEVLVVIDDYLWDGPTGELLKDVLKEEFPALPQSEPMFDVTQISGASFDNLFKFHRSIVLVTINETIEKSDIAFRKNVWARPQILTEIKAANSEELRKVIKLNSKVIQQFFITYDRQRLTDSYQESKDLEIQKMMAGNHHIRLAIPRGYNVDVSSDDYSSVSIETPDFSQVLHVWEYPADGKVALQSGNLLLQRNAFSRKYVKGPREGSFMTTSKNYPPVFYDLKSDHKEIVEIRGLWELENGFMGGPFVSHSVLDEKRQRIVTVEGYVYYPNQKKRIKVRQLEAIIYSLEII
ncbi:MAG: DUF4837 family protein [Bacteroidales bacterium]|nr:DUF4837 family protein [Bacteroidales bacterium]